MKGTRSRSSLITRILGFLMIVVLFACGGIGEVHNPLMISISPENVTLSPGQSHVFQVTVGVEGQDVSLDFRATDPLLCSPAYIIGRSAPFVQDVTVTVPEGTPPGTEGLSVYQYGNLDVAEATASITIPDPNQQPSFTFVASSGLALCPPGLSSPPITFTVTSVGGYAGTVSFDWNDVSGASPSNPTPRPFEVTIAPGAPATFTRTFSRNATHNVDLPITFTGTLSDTNKSVTVIVRHQEVE